MINRLIQISLVVSIAIVIVYLIQRLTKKIIPRSLLIVLWIPILLQLCIPYQIQLKTSMYQPLVNKSVSMQIQEEIELPKKILIESVQSMAEVNQEKEKSNLNLTIPYFLGIGIIVVYKIYKYHQFKKYMKKSQQAKNELTTKISKLWGNPSIPIMLIDNNDFNSAALFGILKPSLLVSTQLASLDDQEIDYIIQHEKTHYTYKHVQFVLLLQVLSIIYWFNPIIYWGMKLVKDDLEYLTDSIVLKDTTMEQRKNYASLLISRAQQQSVVSLQGFGLNSKKKVKERIRNIMENKRRLPWMIAVLLVCIFGIGMFALTKPILEEDIVTLDVPLSYRNYYNQELDFDTQLTTVPIKIEFPKGQGSMVNAEAFEAYIDLNDIQEGEMVLPIFLECKGEYCDNWNYELLQNSTKVVFTSFLKDRKEELQFTLPIDSPYVSCGWECYNGHNAVDIVNKENEYGNVYAVEDGIITENGFDELRGNYVKLQVSEDVVFTYSQMKEASSYIPGERVQKGDIIGVIGESGRATGPHLALHMEVNGIYVNPELYFNF